MISLTFVSDRYFALQHVLRSHGANRDFQAVQYAVWRRDKDLYNVLAQHIAPLTFSSNFPARLKRAVRAHERKLAPVLRSAIFRKVFGEVERYALSVEKQWQKNYQTAVKHLEDITRLPFLKTGLNIKTYVSHPDLSSGRSYPDEGVITWAHREDWKNYATVYLWHEVLHHLTYKYRGNPHLMHALIELACDNELRIRLNGRGEYFKEGSRPLHSHGYLSDLEKKIYPDWIKYITATKLNLYQIERRLRPKLSKKLHHKFSKLEEWAEWH